MKARIDLNGVSWDLFDSGAPLPALVCFPGAMGALDSARAALELLGARRRIIALEYPPFDSMSAFCDGVVALLDALGLDDVDVLGSSFGGYAAQCLVRGHPTRVRDLVLVHAFVLSDKDAGRLRIANRIGPFIPRSLFARLVLLRMTRVLGPIRRSDPARFDTIVNDVRRAIGTAITPESTARNNAWMIEAARSFPMAAGDLDASRSRVMIVESDDDPVVRAVPRGILRAMYPDAHVRTFSGTGHVTALAAPEQFATAVGEYLAVRDNQAVGK